MAKKKGFAATFWIDYDEYGEYDKNILDDFVISSYDQVYSVIQDDGIFIDLFISCIPKSGEIVGFNGVYFDILQIVYDFDNNFIFIPIKLNEGYNNAED